MEKVIFESNIVKSEATGIAVGRIEPSNDSCIDVILNNGCHVYAHYGTTDDEGKFFIFCRNTFACGKSCFGGEENDLSCRYNRKGTKNAGYYVDTSATESVY